MGAPFKAEAIVIGASAGGVQALSQILPHLPAKSTTPVFVVVHLPSQMKSILSELFVPKCKVRVKEAEDKEPIQRGVIYFAPADYHMLVESDGSISLSSDEPELFSRPSINVLFRSAADLYGSGLVGIILTGASNDGAEGLRAVHDAGGVALVQQIQTAEARTMPEAARQACPKAKLLTLDEMGKTLEELNS